MATPGISELVTTTLESRTGEIADNVTRNTALLYRLNERGNIKPFSGGRVIYEELSFRETATFGWYSGYDVLPVTAQEVLSAATFNIKQCSVQVVISGLEELQNSGEEAVIDLLESRMENAEATMMNNMQLSIYSDGTGSGGKELDGLNLALPVDPTTGTYGGIDRSTSLGSFWQSKLYDPASTPTATTIQGYMNTLWAKLVRGTDHTDLIPMGQTLWATYLSSLQSQQRFTDAKLGQAGFTTIKFMTADVVLENYGIADTDAFFLNTKYLRLRPHKERNMKPLGAKRMPVNQDASVSTLAWAGNLTCSNASLQGRFIGA
jgi:hypothetical protein